MVRQAVEHLGEEAAVAQEVETLGQGEEQEMVSPMREVEEVVEVRLTISQTPAPLHQATLASSVQGCTLQYPTALLNLQEDQAQINTFPQFSPRLS